VYGAGQQTRSFCFVDDLVDGLMRLMNQTETIGPVNIGNPGEFTIKQVGTQRLPGPSMGGGPRGDSQPRGSDPSLLPASPLAPRQLEHPSPTLAYPTPRSRAPPQLCTLPCHLPRARPVSSDTPSLPFFPPFPRQLAELAIKHTNSKSKIIHLPLPGDDPQQRKPDITKARRCSCKPAPPSAPFIAFCTPHLHPAPRTLPSSLPASLRPSAACNPSTHESKPSIPKFGYFTFVLAASTRFWPTQFDCEVARDQPPQQTVSSSCLLH
jgi:hypothetical protein